MERDDTLSDDSGLSNASLLNPSELSYDVKVSLVRICSMMEQLPCNDESYELLKKINLEIAKNTGQYMPTREGQNDADQSRSNLQLGVSHSQSSYQRRLNEPLGRFRGRRPGSGSARSRGLNSTLQHINSSFKTSLENSRVVNNSSLHGSNFQPVATGKADHTASIFNYRPIADLNVSTIVESAAEEDAESDISTLTENSDAFFLLRNWSLKKDKNNLYLTGIKLDRKGHLLERDFISKKVLARTPEQLIKTDCGNYKLDDPLTDPNNCIPAEVKKFFLKDKTYFPKFWRKAVALWNEIEEKELKAQENAAGKPRKSNPSEEIKNSGSKGQKKTQGKAPGRPRKSNPAVEDKDSDVKPAKKTPVNIKKPDAQEKPAGKKNGQEKKPSPVTAKISPEEPKKPIEKSAPSKKKEPNKEPKKNDNVNASKQQEKNKKKEDKQTTKKAKNVAKPTKAGTKKMDVLPDEDVFSDASENELVDFGDESMFQIPSTSLTPTGLLSSIKKTTIKGRYTPPTSVFDNIYGKSTTPCSNSSTLDDSFDLAPKDLNVVKRMAKAKAKPSGSKPTQKQFDSKVSQKPALPRLNEESNNLIDMVLDAVHTQSSQTPEIVKKVFRNQDHEDEEEYDSFDNDDDGDM